MLYKCCSDTPPQPRCIPELRDFSLAFKSRVLALELVSTIAGSVHLKVRIQTCLLPITSKTKNYNLTLSILAYPFPSIPTIWITARVPAFTCL
jgi:hypothetical protein